MTAFVGKQGWERTGASRVRWAVRNVWRAPCGSRDAVIAMAAIVAASCAASGADVWADHSATSCILHVRGESHPVTYLDAPRQNPDGTYYPGDAFYYIFRWEDRSDPGDCMVNAPLLETSRLLLDHHAVRVDGDGRMSRSAPLAHTDLDPAVGFLSRTDFYAGRMQTECQVSFAKPGESWRTKWEQWTVYDKVFLTKEGGDGLTEFEKTLKSKAYRGEPAWEWWEQKNKMRSGHPDLPECPFGLRPGGPAEPSAPDLPELPAYMEYYGDGIFYATSYYWGITTNTNASHAHLAATPADHSSTAWFEERVQEMCGKLALPARSGCVYGTAEIRPSGGVCVSDVVDSYARLLHAWHTGLPPYDITSKDGKPVAPPPGPPPGYPVSSWGHLLANRTYPFDLQTPPPGIAGESYEAPAAGGPDTCASPSSDGAKLELTTTGTYLTPHHYANGIPVKGIKKVERDEGPPLQDGELLIILTKPPLHHIQGYDAKNLDGTYYHGDPVYVRHEPSWKWKDERGAHISFATHRLPPVTLPVIDEFDCPPTPPTADGNDTAAFVEYTVAPPCEHTVKVDSPPWLAERLRFGNGDGLTVRTAGTPHGFGIYEFAYNMTAYNLGKMVANATNSTAAEVVPYEPSYETVYSYPVLADAREYAFDDRHGIAMRYGGSWQEDVLHPMRRSFINGWIGTGGGHDPYTYNHFGQAHVLDTGRNSSPGHTALEHVQGTQTAMFVQSGHGTVLFEWPVSGWVFSTYNQTTTGEPAAATTAAKAAVNENVTSYLQIYSRDFAGKDTLLYETTMRYPEMPFAKRVTIQSVDHTGAVQTSDKITLRVTSYAELGAEYLTDYIHDKITWDTDDPIIAQIVVNDTHPMVQEWYAAGGMINGTVLRTSVHFGDIAIQNSTGLPFSGRLADLHELAEHPETLRLSVPYDLGLSVLAPTSLHISINGSGEHAIHHKYYSFGRNETVSINAQKDNPADISREPGRIVIRQPENFGIIKHVEINGTRLQQPCPMGCTVLFQPDTTLDVTLYNEWGGKALGSVGAPHMSNEPRADEPQWQVMGIVAALLALSYMAYRKMTGES